MERSEAARLLRVGPDASARQVRSAFRKLVRAHHPDRNGGRETADFQRLTEARDLLMTPAPATLSGDGPSTAPATGPTARTRTGSTPTTGAAERASRVRADHSRMEFGYDPNVRMAEPDSITRERHAQRQANRVGKGAKGTAFRLSRTVVATAALAALFAVIVIAGLLGAF